MCITLISKLDLSSFYLIYTLNEALYSEGGEIILQPLPPPHPHGYFFGCCNNSVEKLGDLK